MGDVPATGAAGSPVTAEPEASAAAGAPAAEPVAATEPATTAEASASTTAKGATASKSAGDTRAPERTTGRLTTAAQARSELDITHDNYQVREDLFADGELRKWGWIFYENARLRLYQKWWPEDGEDEYSVVPDEVCIGARKGFAGAQGVEKGFVDVQAGQCFGRTPWHFGSERLLGARLTLGDLLPADITAYGGLSTFVTAEKGIPQLRLRSWDDDKENRGLVFGGFLSGRDGAVSGAAGLEYDQFSDDVNARGAISVTPRLARRYLSLSLSAEKSILQGGYLVDGDVQVEIVKDKLLLLSRVERTDRPPFIEFFESDNSSDYTDTRGDAGVKYRPVKWLLIFPMISMGEYFLASRLGLDTQWLGLKLLHIWDREIEPDGHTGVARLYSNISLLGGALQLRPDISLRIGENGALFGDQADFGAGVAVAWQPFRRVPLVVAVEGDYVRQLYDEHGDPGDPEPLNQIEIAMNAVYRTDFFNQAVGPAQLYRPSQADRAVRFVPAIDPERKRDLKEFSHGDHYLYFVQEEMIKANGGKIECDDCHSSGLLFRVTRVTMEKVCDKCHGRWDEKPREGDVFCKTKFDHRKHFLGGVDRKGEKIEIENTDEKIEDVKIKPKNFAEALEEERDSHCFTCHSDDGGLMLLGFGVEGDGSYKGTSRLFNFTCRECHLTPLLKGEKLKKKQKENPGKPALGPVFTNPELTGKHPVEIRGPGGNPDPKTFPTCETCHQEEIERTLGSLIVWMIPRHRQQHPGTPSVLSHHECKDCHDEGKVENAFYLEEVDAVPVEIILPHPLPWVDFHAGEARADIEYCRICHSGDTPSPVEGHEGLAIPTCRSCHIGDYTIIGSPHDLGFRRGHVHGPEGELNPRHCETCHTNGRGVFGFGFCVTCHKERAVRKPQDIYHGLSAWLRVDPQLNEVIHAFVAGRSGGRTCAACHVPMDFVIFYEENESCQANGCHGGDRRGEGVR